MPTVVFSPILVHMVRSVGYPVVKQIVKLGVMKTHDLTCSFVCFKGVILISLALCADAVIGNVPRKSDEAVQQF